MRLRIALGQRQLGHILEQPFLVSKERLLGLLGACILGHMVQPKVLHILGHKREQPLVQHILEHRRGQLLLHNLGHKRVRPLVQP